MDHASRTTGFLVAAVVLVPLVSMTGPVAAHSDPSSWTTLQQNGSDVQPDQVVIEVELHSDGTARWNVQYRVRLHNQTMMDAFAAVRERIESNRLERAGTFRLRAKPTVTAASNETGREMELRAVTVDAEQRQVVGAPDRYGVVTYTFEWTNFAAVGDGTLVAGNALSQFFLGDQTTMLVTWPEDYRLVEAEPGSDEDRNDAVVWRGPKEFTADGPRVVVEPTDDASTTLPVSPVWLAAAAVLTAALAAGWHRRRESGTAGTDNIDSSSSTPSSASASASGASAELLSDEERILRLLEENDGRMKQQAVIETLDWSETKASQVVTDLHDAEKIERYRLGRENVLALPGEMDV